MERLGGFQIDDQLEFPRLDDRQLRDRLPLEEAARIQADQAVGIHEACAIGQKPAGGGKLGVLESCRHGMACAQRPKFLPASEKERIITDQKRRSWHPVERLHSRSKIALSA